jgi:hypothetical protein
MNDIKFTVLLFFLLIVSSVGFSQTLKNASLTEAVIPITGTDGEVLSRKLEYDINCELFNGVKSTIIKDAVNWKVYGNGKILPLSTILWREFRPLTVKLVGPFEGYDNLTVEFMDGGAVHVNVDSSAVGGTKWGFGKGKAVDLNLRRLTNQKALYAFDYDLNIKILERTLATPGENFWIRSLSFDAVSTGTLGSSNEIRNGTQSSLGLAIHPFYFVGGLIYEMNVNIAYQLETAMDSSGQALIKCIDKQFKAGLEIEIPYSNYPIYKLHTVTGYARLAMPLILNADYLPKGRNEVGDETPARLDMKARYELAFSPYFIIQGEWNHSLFTENPTGTDRNTDYYSFAIAQDLDVVKETLGFLKLFLGGSEEIRGKNFIFYRISSGKKAPAFQDLREQSFGFGTYF